jgi:hypothetical protein
MQFSTRLNKFDLRSDYTTIISEVQFSVITKNVNIPGKKTKKGFKLKIIKMIIDGMCIKIKIKRNKCFDWLFQNSVVCYIWILIVSPFQTKGDILV